MDYEEAEYTNCIKKYFILVKYKGAAWRDFGGGCILILVVIIQLHAFVKGQKIHHKEWFLLYINLNINLNT